MKRREYYPPGTSHQNGEHCGHPAQTELERYYSKKCLLDAGHEGKHNFSANWNAHVEVEMLYNTVSVEFRSWHDNRALDVHNKAEADALLAFLRRTFDDWLEN